MSLLRVNLGLAATSSWLTFVGIYVYFKWEKFLGMEPNSIGDFVAGAAGPVAFLWLVLGYFQQGEELGQSTSALTLQAKELSQSVEQQKALVEATREQFHFELGRERERRLTTFLASQPRFDLSVSKTDVGQYVHDAHYEIRALNFGRDCARARLERCFEQHAVAIESRDQALVFPSGEAVTWRVVVKRTFEGFAAFSIHYTDSNGQLQSQTFSLEIRRLPSEVTQCFIDPAASQVFPWEDPPSAGSMQTETE